MKTSTLAELETQLTLMTRALNKVCEGLSTKQMEERLPIEITLIDLVALSGVAHTAHSFLTKHRDEEFDSRCQMLEHGIAVIGATLVHHYPDAVKEARDRMINEKGMR